jgi:ATP-dependent DNA helicase RecG
MHELLTRLYKMCDLEIKNGYDDKAVIGGLTKMLAFWEPLVRRAGFDSARLDALVAQVKTYSTLPEAERPAVIQTVLAQLKELDAAPKGAAPSAKPGPTAPPRAQSSPPSPRTAPPPTRPPAPQAQTPPAQQPKLPAPQKREALPPPPPAPPIHLPPTASEPVTSPLNPASIPEPPAVPVVEKQPRPEPKPQQQPKPKPQPQPQHHQRPRSDFSNFNEEPLDPRPRRPAGPRPLKGDAPVNPNAGLDAPLTVLSGIGPERLKDYQRLGLNTLRDLLYDYPRRYDNYATMKTINRLEYGEECSIIGAITDSRLRKFRNSQQGALKVVLSDPTGAIELTFFNASPWLARNLAVGKQIVVAGRIQQYLGRLTLTNPDWEYLDRDLINAARIAPVYRLTEGVTQHGLRKLTWQTVEHWAPQHPDPLPAAIVARAGLLSLGEALAQIHFPDNETRLAAAQHRLAFDELLLLQLGVLRQRQEWQSFTAAPLVISDEAFLSFVNALPYRLTNAQVRALADIRADLGRATPMNRLLEGDVGSGKTVVAAAAMLVAVQAGAQAALMAPTSILAEQHYRNIAQLLSSVVGQPASVRLLQGSTPASEKEEIYNGLRTGEIKIVVGTHALIEGPVEFANLGLAVVDEQHRFGVAQRAALRSKGGNPHLLVMTATPIPRTLALTVYGDLDLSVLDEMPPGRQPITTHILHADRREQGYAFVRREVQKGRQAFCIFPLVEESEKSEAKAAVSEHERLQKEVFQEFKLGLLHGRLKPDEKDDVMTRFRAGEFQILVSTSVVEVGVDVPNATVMLIEGANRFGLAQLHQFRGRVGRGEHASYCVLVSDAPNPRSDERLTAMEESQDGFVLAEKDLDLRGPGDFLGTRQAGFAPFRMAKLSDVQTIEKARREAQLLFAQDAPLALPEHQMLAQNLAKFWEPGAGDVS